MSEKFNPDSEIITNAVVFYLYALIVTYKDGYQCVFDISDLVSDHVIHQPFRDNPLFFCDFVVAADGSKINWNIDYASDNIRERSVALDAVIQFIKEQSQHRTRMIARESSDPFAKEKARNRRKNHKFSPFESDPLGKALTKSILKVEVFAPFILRLTYKDGYKCFFDFDEYILNTSYNQNDPSMFYDYEMDSLGTNVKWKNFEINAECIRELSVPMNEIIQWIREETEETKEGQRNQ